MIARNQAAHHAHIALRAFELGFGGFEVAARIGDVFLCAADFRGDAANLLIGFGLHGGELCGELLVRGDLFLADGFGAALGLRDFAGVMPTFCCVTSTMLLSSARRVFACSSWVLSVAFVFCASVRSFVSFDVEV